MMLTVYVAKRTAVTVMAILLLGLHLFCGQVEAKTVSLGCEKVWTGPSKDNDVMKCVQDPGKANDLKDVLVSVALCVLIFVFLLIIFPFFFFCRQCCNLCGGKHRQPGYCCTARPEEWMSKSSAEKDAIAYTPGQRACAKIFVLILMLLGAASVVIMNTGAGVAIKAVDSTFVNVDVKVLGNLSGTERKINALMQEPSSPTGLINNISNSTTEPISKMVNDMRNSTQSARSTVASQSAMIQLISGLLSAVPIIFLCPLVLFALLNVRRCGPACCSCFYYFIALIFSLIGIIMFVIAIILALLCGEVDLYHAGQPGLLKWYAVPLCEDQIGKTNVSGMTAEFDKQHESLSGDACIELAKACSPTTAFAPGTPELVFQCSLTPLNARDQCKNSTAVLNVLGTSNAKTGINPCQSGTVACNMTGCSVDCDNPATKTAMSTALKTATFANKLSQVVDIAKPILRCDYMLEVVLKTFDDCHPLSDGVYMIASTFLIGAAIMTAGIFAAFFGQKRFSPPASVMVLPVEGANQWDSGKAAPPTDEPRYPIDDDTAPKAATD